METDGALPDGTALTDAVKAVDEATGGAPVHYMVYCAHPMHMAPVLEVPGPWLARLWGIRANPSPKSHHSTNQFASTGPAAFTKMVRSTVVSLFTLPWMSRMLP